MVTRRSSAAVLTVTLVLVLAANAECWTGSYSIQEENVKVWINPNGSIDLFYNITLWLAPASDNISFIEVGQPKGDFTVGEAVDQYENSLTASDQSSESDYKVRVYLSSPLTAGNTIWLTLATNVGHMVFTDDQNPGNVGIQFTPSWWPQAPVYALRVLIVLPPEVNSTILKTSVDWDNFLPASETRWAAYWQREDLQPDQRYTFGVSFPKEFVQNYETGPSGLDVFLQQYVPALLVVGFFIMIIILIAFAVRKSKYLMPSVSMETLGARRGLTAVEASYLVDLKPPRIVTEILYSLLQKRAVWVESANPSVKLKLMAGFENKTGTAETHLRYYEIDFLEALKEDGTLDEEKLAHTVMYLRDTVEEKLRGYCRRDTVNYYRTVATKAWAQVEQAGTPELASKTYDEQLLWLFLDPDVGARTETAFRGREFEPSPLWLWYWYGYSHYMPHPTYTPSVNVPGQTGKPPAIPGADFANNIATAVENTSNSIVLNLERFANAIVPSPPKASSQPAHHNAGCVCACAACACACVCVSCACACAGGGAG